MMKVSWLVSWFWSDLGLLVLFQDPSRNHKSYRDLITSLRPPLIPFTPLMLKGQQVM